MRAALEHREPDRVPVDLGATSVTGMHVATVDRVRRVVFDFVEEFLSSHDDTV